MSLVRGGTLGCVCAAALSMAAFAASSAFAASTATPDSVATTASGRCGTLPYVAPNDPTHLVRGLGKSYPSSYVGWRDYPIVKSAWANWKPKRKSGLNVQIVWVPPTNPLTNAALQGIKDTLRASGKVKTIQTQYVNSQTDVPGQLQMMNTALERKPDMIVLFPLSGTALTPLVNKAGKAGIPTVIPTQGVPGKYAVGVNTNLYLGEGIPAASTLRQMGGKGSVLQVYGIKGAPTDTVAKQAWTKALSRCPNVKVIGDVQGFYDNTATKAVTQQFLATHPAGVQGVFQLGTMGPGVLGAFTQTGKTVPAHADGAAAEGTLAYWHGHSSYKTSTALTPQRDLGVAMAKVAVRMLKGDGVKINLLLDKPFIISKRSQLNAVYKSSYKEGGLAGVAPPSGTYFSNPYLNGFFAHGGK